MKSKVKSLLGILRSHALDLTREASQYVLPHAPSAPTHGDDQEAPLLQGLVSW